MTDNTYHTGCTLCAFCIKSSDSSFGNGASYQYSIHNVWNIIFVRILCSTRNLGLAIYPVNFISKKSHRKSFSLTPTPSPYGERQGMNFKLIILKLFLKFLQLYSVQVLI